uniref:Uncharacterized protein n=1 Tax=Amphimedon queenslandica TaxID=400682 RepID=A0A1X7V848_AMPQE
MECQILYETFLGLLFRTWKQVLVVAVVATSLLLKHHLQQEVPALSESNTLKILGRGKAKSSLQNKAKRKIALKTHSFICLSSIDTYGPLILMQIADLMRAGLRRNELLIFNGGDSSNMH